MSTSSKRWSLLIVLGTFCALGAVGLMSYLGMRARAPERLAAREPHVEPEWRPTRVRHEVSERFAEIDARRRVPPDRRALHALASLRALMVGSTASAGSPRAVYRDGEWQLLSEETEIGTLPELAGFGEILAVLEARARHLASAAVAPLRPDPTLRRDLLELLERFDDAAAFAVLADVDARWQRGEASVGDLHAAARALAQLSLMLWDDFEIADRLQGQALATLALARHHGSDALRAECHLALALEYSGHALRCASKLPAGDPFRAYLEGDVEGVRALAVRADGQGAAEAKFLRAMSLGDRRRFREWTEWLREVDFEARPLPFLRTYLTVGGLQSGWVPDFLAFEVQRAMGVPDPPDPQNADVFARADELMLQLERRAGERTGPFASSDHYRDYYRAHFFSAIYRKYYFHNNTRGSRRDLKAFADTLAISSDPAVQAAAEFAGLMDFRARTTLPESRRRSEALSEPSVLGARQRLHLARMLYVPLSAHDPDRVDVADAMRSWLDSRPRHLRWAYELARDVYLDPELERELAEATAASHPRANVELRTLLAKRRGDVSELWSMLDELRVVADRLRVLHALGSVEGVDLEQIRWAYERELAADPRNAQLRGVYAHFLWETDQRVAARRALRGLLEDPGDTPRTDLAHVVARLARFYRIDEQPGRAWELLEPQLETWVGVVLSEAVLTQIDLGELEGAEAIARGARKRYPGADTSAHLASVLWRQRRHREAAEVVLESPDQTSSNARNHLIGAFIRAFGDAGDEEMEAAFRELVAARVPWDLTQGIIVTLREERARPDLAFAFTAHMDYPPNLFVILTEGYLSLREVRGEQAALDWLRPRFRRHHLHLVAPIFHLRGAHELVWTLTTHPKDGQGGDETWLLRAAGWLLSPEPSEEHERMLLTHYRAHTKSFRNRVGGALLGLRSEEDLLQSATTEGELSIAAAFLGLRAEMRGRPRDALRLYQLARSARPTGTQDYVPIRRLEALRERWSEIDVESAVAERAP